MIGEFIKLKRKRAGMSGEQLATHITSRRSERATKSWLSRVEDGSVDLSLSQFMQVAAAFGMQPSQFLAEYEQWALRSNP